MIIKLNENYTADISERLLGYQGETNARTINFEGLEVEGADSYKMRVQYADGVAYEIDIINGSYKVEGSLLRTRGYADCQIFACKINQDGNYTLVKKSDIFKLEIKGSLNSDVEPIPTYEKSQGILEEFSKTAEKKLDKVLNSENLFDVSKILEGCVRNGVNRVSNENYFTTEDITVDSGKESLFCGTANADGTLTAQKFRVALFVLEDGTTQYTNYVSVVPIPENAVSFMGTFANSVKENKIYIGYGTSCKGVSYEPYGSFDVLEKLINTSDTTAKNTADIGTLNAVKTSRISDIMKPLFADGSNLQIKLIGDSITMGAQGTGVNDNDPNNDLIYIGGSRSYYENTAGHCWANNLRDYFKKKFGCTVKNYGVTGSTSWAILNYIDNIVHDEDDICVVCIGINDRVKTAKDTTYTQIKNIYNAITAKGKKCILMSEIPVSAANESKYNTQDYHSEDVDIIYQKIASELDIEYISLFKLMSNYCTEHGITIDTLLAPDGLHPNDNGYDVIFGLVSNALGVAVSFANPADDSTFKGLNAKIAQNTEDINILKTEKNFELIDTITVTEENTARIDRSSEPDGTVYNFEKVYVEITMEASDAAHPLTISVNGDKAIAYTSGINTAKKYTCAYGILMNGMLFGLCSSASSTYGFPSAYMRANAHIGVSSINSVQVKTSSTDVSFSIGSVFKIYGVRK